jgi:hypothetical protein
MTDFPEFLRVQLFNCPTAGAGVHSWLLSAANACRRAGLTALEAELLLKEHMTRPPSPVSEIRSTVTKAYSSSGNNGPLPYRVVSMAKVQFRPDRLETTAKRVAQPRNWRHWLWERSPKRPETQNAYSFLKCLFLPGEKVHIFDDLQAKAPLRTLAIEDPMDCRVPSAIRAGGCGKGIWFLANPVDGAYHPNPRQDTLSCRSEESVTSFRFLVLESDQARAEDWLPFVAQLPIRIAAIYTSGSRSIHSLLRVDAGSKAEFDEIVGPLKRPLKSLGADSACLSAVRLTRLPGCQRPEKKGFQRLLYLNPTPPAERLIDLPIIFSRAAMLERWRSLCPKWNSTMGAYQ